MPPRRTQKSTARCTITKAEHLLIRDKKRSACNSYYSYRREDMKMTKKVIAFEYFFQTVFLIYRRETALFRKSPAACLRENFPLAELVAQLVVLYTCVTFHP